MSFANLEHTNMRNASIIDTKLDNAYMLHTNLSGVNISEIDVSKASVFQPSYI